MKKEMSKTIEIPEGVDISLEGSTIFIKGQEGENKKEFNTKGFSIKLNDKEICLNSKKATKTEKKLLNTAAAHIRNMILGVQNKFKYELKVCFSHFPITVDIQGNEATIKNFLGEKIPRKCKIIEGTEVKIDKQNIIVTSRDKELAGQTAANFEKATKVRNRDRRVFQDGIFIIFKNKKEDSRQ